MDNWTCNIWTIGYVDLIQPIHYRSTLKLSNLYYLKQPAFVYYNLKYIYPRYKIFKIDPNKTISYSSRIKARAEWKSFYKIQKMTYACKYWNIRDHEAKRISRSKRKKKKALEDYKELEIIWTFIKRAVVYTAT